jgi:hypothetical protein
MKKIFKWIGLIILLVYTVALVMDKLDKRPFRFEKFKTEEELEVFLYAKYPTGSDVDSIVTLIRDAGAKCDIVTKQQGIPFELKKYEYVVWCEYFTGWFSFHPLENYMVIILGNKDRKIINILTGRTKGIVI